MNSTAGDRVVATFARPLAPTRRSNLATYSIPNIPATAGIVSTENEATAVQTLTAGLTYQMTQEIYNPSGTSTWDAANTGTRIFVYGPV